MRINPCRRSAVHATVLALSLLAPLAALGQTPPPAQVAGRFAGNWVEDPSQRKTGAERSLTFRNGPNGLEELRGSYSRPLVESVRFGTAPYAFGETNATMEWKQLGDGRFERTMMENGKPVEIRQITVSPDGKTLTEISQRNLPDGKKTTTTIVYARSSGSGQKLDGVWKPQTVRSDTPFKMSIQSVGNTLKVSTGSGLAFALTFDGKPAAVTGPVIISGTTSTGKIVSDDVIEIANARLGTPAGMATWTLSANGKTLTTSFKALGPDATKEPSVSVYLKQ